MRHPRLGPLLVCPVCHGAVSFEEGELRCGSCGRRYPVTNGVPILLHPESRYAAFPVSAPAESRSGRLMQRVVEHLPSRRGMTMWIDRTMFELLGKETPEALVLNLGSGVGAFDRYVASHVNMINLDVTLNDRTHLVADGHHLPFADGSLDAVFSNAVLEHVARPWVVANEIYRVLRPGGRVYVNVPFLNVIHDREDYFRFTDQGLRSLFAEFEEVSAGVSAGPSSFVGPFMVEYLLLNVPTRPLQILMRQVLSLAARPLKYMDYAVRRNPRLRVTADAFYFVGRKRADRS